VARHAYKSEKRRKETTRLKKQEEKRQRRFGAKVPGEEGETEATEGEVLTEGQEAASDEKNTGEAEEAAPEKA
jgi:hypothetical protein